MFFVIFTETKLLTMIKFILSAALSFLTVASFACTNLIVGKKASVDGSVMCTYNCDGFGFASRSATTRPAATRPAR